MYSYQLDEMTQAVFDALNPILLSAGRLDAEQDIRNALTRYWSDKIALTWTAEDVKTHAKGMGYEVTDEQAVQILQGVLHDHDASYGVSWSSFEENITNLGKRI